MIHIIYYVFVGLRPHWQGSVKGQLEDLIISGLIKKSQLHICLSGSSKEMSQARVLIDQLVTGVTIDYSYTEQNLYEYPGIHKLHSLANASPNDIYLYLHTKGVSRTQAPMDRSIDNIYLTRLTVWNQDRILSIFNDHPEVNKIGYFPAGGGWMWFNFFWVRGSYLKKCCEPVITTRRHYYEDWLGSSLLEKTKSASADCYCLYNDTIGYYFTPCIACQTVALLYSRVKFLAITQKIKKVVYGTSTVGQQIDITVPFNQLIEQKYSFGINNAIAGHDPCYGVVKQLVITYQNGETETFREGDHLLLAKKA